MLNVYKFFSIFQKCQFVNVVTLNLSLQNFQKIDFVYGMAWKSLRCLFEAANIYSVLKEDYRANNYSFELLADNVLINIIW